MSFTVNSACALCGTHTEEVLTLTATPPANALEPPGAGTVAIPVGSGKVQLSTPVYPLDLRLCSTCGHLQLGVTVDPETLFRGYLYVSPPGMLNHWRLHAAQMIPRFGLKPKDLVCEIGSNNGDLLSFYRDAGMQVLGFEPAKAIVEIAEAHGVPTVETFFTSKIAEKWKFTGGAKLVLANNVFAHIRDLRDVVDGVKTILAPDGVFIFEVHWRGTLVNDGDWPSIYHEHLHYHTVYSLQKFLASCGMSLFDVQAIDTHNGSIRCFAHQTAHDPNLWYLDNGTRTPSAVDTFKAREHELGLFTLPTYTKLAERIERARYEFRQLFDALVWGPINAGGVAPKVAVLGCPAKLTTLAYHLGLSAHEITYVVDDEPLKQGKLTPGKRWPIFPFEHLAKDPPGIALVGAYNYAPQLIARVKKLFEEHGLETPLFINPFPTPRVTK